MMLKSEFVQAFVLNRAGHNGTTVEEDITYALKAFDMLENMRTKLENEKQDVLDGKVHGALYSNKDGHRIPASEYVIFRPRDNAFAAILPLYREMCRTLGAKKEQLAAVDRLITKVNDWRVNYPDRCKTPDVEPGELPRDW